MMKVIYGIVAATAIALSSFFVGTRHWNLDQSFFPCQEDEVLGYSPVNHERVVCIHIDALK